MERVRLHKDDELNKQCDIIFDMMRDISSHDRLLLIEQIRDYILMDLYNQSVVYNQINKKSKEI